MLNILGKEFLILCIAFFIKSAKINLKKRRFEKVAYELQWLFKSNFIYWFVCQRNILTCILSTFSNYLVWLSLTFCHIKYWNSVSYLLYDYSLEMFLFTLHFNVIACSVLRIKIGQTLVFWRKNGRPFVLKHEPYMNEVWVLQWTMSIWSNAF